MTVLLALGIAVAVLGYSMLREEWGRTQRAPREAQRFELVLIGCVLIGGGVAMAYASLSA